MIGNYFARLTGSKRNLLALLASSVVLTAGCANMSSTAPSANPFSAEATLGGNVHGGNQPVIGATVNLWFVGQSSAAIQVATTTTDSKGSFSFTKGPNDQPNSGTTNTFSCPTSGSGADPVVYVVSKGGNTQNNGVPGQTNAAAAFIAVYPGTCTSLSASNFVFMSEVTTVATMAAVSQFFNPVNDNITADGTGQQKPVIANISNTIALLANPATGLAIPSTTIPANTGGNIPAGVSLTATPEVAKLNTLANIISACINGATSSAAACGTLFSSAAPPQLNTTTLNPGSFPAATDTLQALYYIFTNPTNGSSANLSAIFGLNPSVGAPYLPALATQPTDWTIGISYASTSGCTSGNFISSPTDINIDSLDNVWFGNAQAGGNLSSISAAGAPLNCVNFDAGTSATGSTMDSFSPILNSYAYNIWFAGGTTMYRYNPFTRATLAFPVGVTPLAITADGAGNVFFSAVSGSTGSVYELAQAATALVAVPAVQISNSVGPNPIRMMADNTAATPQFSTGNIWVSSGSTFISKVSPSGAAGNLNGFATTPFTTSGNSYGLVLNSNSSVFVSAVDSGVITQFSRSGSSWIPTASGWPFALPGNAGISAPTGIAVDGRGTTWIPNSGAASLSSVSLFGANALSSTSGLQKAATFFNTNRAAAIDQAGNIWVIGTGNNFITEVVGGAVPLYAPYAIGISNGRFQSIP